MNPKKNITELANINGNRIIMEGRSTRVVLSEKNVQAGGVSIQEGIILAQRLANEIIKKRCSIPSDHSATTPTGI